jgi:hypothetical protein
MAIQNGEPQYLGLSNLEKLWGTVGFRSVFFSLSLRHTFGSSAVCLLLTSALSTVEEQG